MNNMSKSAALYERAKTVMPGGCSRNTILRKPHPIYVAKAQGCHVTDIEGVERIDFANNVASLIHGHAHPDITRAVIEQIGRGTAFTVGTEVEVVFAEQMVSRNSSFEKIRFVNSGTEAVMSCIKAARAFTDRPKIAKVEGAYHGLYDYAEVSQTARPSNWGSLESPTSVPVSRGTPESALSEVVVIPFNELDRAIAILDLHKADLAAIVIDLLPHRIGVIQATQEFVLGLSKWATKNGALLIVDEVITFRTNFDGAQGSYAIKPDLTAMGKMIGGGFPVGALAGRADVMDVMNPLNGPAPFPHSGTFSANPITMTAGLVAMQMFDRDAVASLNSLADRARAGIAEAIKIADVPACVTGAGSMFRIHLKGTAPTSYRSAFAGPKEQNCISALLDHFFSNGLLMIETCSGLLSTPMTEAEIDRLSEVVLDGLRLVRPMLDDIQVA
ncbi:aspartate aminotransferase family protein [Mesorhizobium sp. M8A.F.Ca.ET.208.01.1.1]|uniref:aspartate aminotransferase family protein n=1 Tax=unclassified Mesorhizobium TaxID=325217 RepID=UPI000F75DC1A|nr:MULTISPECIES: aspartate aminotransferase family protein [unclassified Mesorhizobium]RUX09034.1 aspartate aminotransferase family protein [Mesorhizobium sp. M8A.F.Ca.ET.059.01.1.1]AZO54354.1 aspartate aminotransferase family protein [Mesorhizobium sp. M8A.F.Ca.ET.057.01.1.1]RWE49794.1 MAG: aspartate aminotransferase family protein [Mesorhizobium sp.]TGQ94524.1 aspartate aminotransferase family protein [Mesorhizobium sp. M8A.F.Ca.ET.208.01.1.1]TGT55012.1 aspartate aminotransferase family prot